MNCCNLTEKEYANTSELRDAFFTYIADEIVNKNGRKAERILEIANTINCFKCFDIGHLITERKFLPISSLDCNGSFDLIHCDLCCDGSIIKPTKYFKEKKIKALLIF